MPSGTAAAAPATALAAPSDSAAPARTGTISLNGEWSFCLEQKDAGLPADTASWRNVIVPHTWQIETENATYMGVGSYRRTFEALPAWSDCAVRIEFESVFHTATVWINGTEVGRHNGKGYTAFAFDITKHLRFGQPNTIVINATQSDFMAEMLPFADSPYLRMNMDTGNTFIAGQDPVAFVEQFKDMISHVHVKDVSDTLAAAARGDLTGIAVSHCAIGDGVNSAISVAALNCWWTNGYDGVLSMECEGQGGPMIEKSLAWLKALIAELTSRPVAV
jgi:hypothetical protein